MSYEEIDKSSNGSDVFTKNAGGRYARAKPPSAITNDTTVESSSTTTNGERKKTRAPKIVVDKPDNTAEYGYGNPFEEVSRTPKSHKKSHSTTENGGTIHDNGNSAAVDQEVPEKTKKKRAPKAVADTENGDHIATSTGTEEPTKKKKSKAPQASVPFDDEFHIVESVPLDDPSGEVQSKVKKTKKNRAPKPPPPSDDFVDLQVTNLDDAYNPNGGDGTSVYNDNAYGSNVTGVPDEYSQQLPGAPSDGEPLIAEPDKSEFETGILNAYSTLAQGADFSKYVGEDQWSIVHLPKSGRQEGRSRIRKMLPGGGKDEKSDGKTPAKPNNQKVGILSRFRSGIGTLVRDEKNLIFGEHSKYDMAYYEEEEDGVDTDDLHRYAQRLRELEDTDREINPEFLVLRDGKTVYGVHETDADGKMQLSTRKPIYDRYGDQTPDEPMEKKKLLSRLRNPFSRNKDKDKGDLKGGSSPKPGSATPDASGSKRSGRKSAGKTLDADMTTMANNDSMVD